MAVTPPCAAAQALSGASLEFSELALETANALEPRLGVQVKLTAVIFVMGHRVVTGPIAPGAVAAVGVISHPVSRTAATVRVAWVRGNMAGCGGIILHRATARGHLLGPGVLDRTGKHSQTRRHLLRGCIRSETAIAATTATATATRVLGAVCSLR